MRFCADLKPCFLGARERTLAKNAQKLGKCDLATTVSMGRSRQELSTDMVIDSGIFKNNQTTPFPCFIFIPKTGSGLPEIGPAKLFLLIFF